MGMPLTDSQENDLLELLKSWQNDSNEAYGWGAEDGPLHGKAFVSFWLQGEGYSELQTLLKKWGDAGNGAYAQAVRFLENRR
jgi:hypothetical protein